jgi:hypothetical protein
MWGDPPPRRSRGIQPYQWFILVVLILLGLYGVYKAGQTGIPVHRPPAPSTGATR